MSQPAVTSITLDRPRLLLFRPSDAIAAERALGGESFEDSLSKRGFTRAATLLWAGLRHEDDRLTVERVGKLLDRTQLSYGDLWNTLADALRASGLLRASDDQDPTPAPALAPGTSGA